MIERLRQIIDYYGLNTSQFEQKISVSNGTIRSAMARNRGLNSDVIIKILEINHEISPDWLLLGKGKMLRQNDANFHQNEPKNNSFEEKNVKNVEKHNISSHETDRESAQYKAAEGNDGWQAVTIADLHRENERLWQRYDDAQQLIGSLRAELKAVRERAAEYAKEKTEPSGTTTQVEG